jgi:hypothetical protein
VDVFEKNLCLQNIKNSLQGFYYFKKYYLPEYLLKVIRLGFKKSTNIFCLNLAKTVTVTLTPGVVEWALTMSALNFFFPSLNVKTPASRFLGSIL